jgi:hypothetical protein
MAENCTSRRGEGPDWEIEAALGRSPRCWRQEGTQPDHSVSVRRIHGELERISALNPRLIRRVRLVFFDAVDEGRTSARALTKVPSQPSRRPTSLEGTETRRGRCLPIQCTWTLIWTPG